MRTSLVNGLAILFFVYCLLIPCLSAGDLHWSDPANIPSPPKDSPGFGSRDANLDLLRGFESPPPGYGQVPFWWWTGDPLDKERLLWQIEELYRKGVSGMQVNYAHDDTRSRLTFPAEPELFSDKWWDVWEFVADECGKRDMGIGLSGYTLDWPNGESLVSRTIYSEREIQGREIAIARRIKVKNSERVSTKIDAGFIGVHAYPVRGDGIEAGGVDLSGFVKDGQLQWAVPDGQWEILVFTAERKAGTLNPMHPFAGKRVIEKFFQRFQDNARNKSAKGLNYFFHDELKFGVGDYIWVDDFAEVFSKIKGYDVFEILPGLFEDIGPMTAKARLDFMDVKVQLAEERYFRPIFDWHWSRGMIYGCDQGSRGKKPLEFGDYFRSVRWYTAPGHDTPRGRADVIKGKVSSSVAHLYKRPRVWLEGYHSMGWGAAPQQLMYATCENYIYGCTLLNLHGLYYSTHGSYWEWAPPSYHFRMPYWEHMDVFMKYFERLSYLMSQGVHRCDVAMIYPVAPLQADMDGQESKDTSFYCGSKLVEEGVDFDFMDFQSLDRAEIIDRKLHVSGEQYSVLVLPSMKAIRWSTILKAREFYRKGGKVVCVGALPQASDRAGSNDPELDAVVMKMFGASASQPIALSPMQISAAGGIAMPVAGRAEAVDQIIRLAGRDVRSKEQIRSVHRKIGNRDVYMVMGASKGSECFFRAHGGVELWDPWTGKTTSVDVVSITTEGTTVRMPLGISEAQVIVFDTKKQAAVSDQLKAAGKTKSFVLDGMWEFELKPTMDNRWGDFRLPVTQSNMTIGAEARIFKYRQETEANPGWQKSDLDDSVWQRVTYGFGQKFFKLGPLPDDIDHGKLQKQLADLKYVDGSAAIEIDGGKYEWTPYEFSWRWGLEGDPGHQGYHGLKEKITDDFICLGKPKIRRKNRQVIEYLAEDVGSNYYLWTSVVAPEELEAKIFAGGLTPKTIYVNGDQVDGLDKLVTLKSGRNPLLICYDKPGRGHVVFEKSNSVDPKTKTPLSMQWYDRRGVLAYDVRSGESEPVGWYRFTAPPGLKEMNLTVFGEIKTWVDGKAMKIEKLQELASGAAEYRIRISETIPGAAKVALRVQQDRGFYGGSALPEVIQLKCGRGLMALGDWSQAGVLENYSGGAWYRKTVTLNAEQVRNNVVLDMGDVAVTAEVHVNGKLAGVRVAPPWKVDVSEFVKAGENRIEILVYNTLANHYLTIPTWYRGSGRSGLIGPVLLEVSQGCCADSSDKFEGVTQ